MTNTNTQQQCYLGNTYPAVQMPGHCYAACQGNTTCGVPVTTITKESITVFDYGPSNSTSELSKCLKNNGAGTTFCLAPTSGANEGIKVGIATKLIMFMVAACALQGAWAMPLARGAYEETQSACATKLCKDSGCSDCIEFHYYPLDGGDFSQSLPGDVLCSTAVDLSGYAGSDLYVMSLGDRGYVPVFGHDDELAITNNNACPPGDAAGVLARIDRTPTCTFVGKITSTAGMTCYPAGSGGALRTIGKPRVRLAGIQFNQTITAIEKRATTCGRFVESQLLLDTSTATRRLTDNADCTSSSIDCPQTASKTTGTSETSSYSVNAGGSIGGLFDIGASYGKEYTTSQEVSYSAQFSIKAGQCGYLGGDQPAKLLIGSFTECSDGQDRPGTITLTSGGFTTRVVNSSC